MDSLSSDQESNLESSTYAEIVTFSPKLLCNKLFKFCIDDHIIRHKTANHQPTSKYNKQLMRNEEAQNVNHDMFIDLFVHLQPLQLKLQLY